MESDRSYIELRKEEDSLSSLLFGDLYPSGYHRDAIDAALVASLSFRGINAFNPPFWCVCTDDFTKYDVVPVPCGRFSVRLDNVAAFRDVELWKYAIGRAERDTGLSLSGKEAFLAAGFMPWTDTAVIAIALLKQAIRAGAP